MKIIFRLVCAILLCAFVFVQSCAKKDNNPASTTSQVTTHLSNLFLYNNGTLYDSLYCDSLIPDSVYGVGYSKQYYGTPSPSASQYFVAFTNDSVGTYPATSKTAGCGYSFFGAGPYSYTLSKQYAQTGYVKVTSHNSHLISGSFYIRTDSTSFGYSFLLTGSFTNLHVRN